MELPATSTHEPRSSIDFARTSGAMTGGVGGEGKRIRLGVSEVGSSRERGCMM